MIHWILKDLQAKGHSVKVLLHNANHYKITEIYTYDGIDVFPPQHQIIENLMRWCHAVITHLDYTKWTIHSAKMFKKPVFHLIHNTHVYPAIVDAEKHQHIVYNSLWAKEKLRYNWSNFILTPPVDWRHYDVNLDTEHNEYITLINLNENKGGRVFLDIARAMPNRKFLGVLGSYEEQIIPKLPNVTIVPNTTNIKQWYEKTRILLMPSEYESWGRTATEAMCSGIPVISSMAEGLVENCGTAGIFIKDRNDVKSWVEAIAKLDDKKAYAKTSRKAKERSRELDPRKALDEFEQWFREMVYKYN